MIRDYCLHVVTATVAEFHGVFVEYFVVFGVRWEVLRK